MMSDPSMASHESMFLPQEGRERESIFGKESKDELRDFLLQNETELLAAFPPSAQFSRGHSGYVKAVDRAVQRFERWRTAGRVTLSPEEMDAKVVEARYRHIPPDHPQWEFAEANMDLVRFNSSWSLSKKIRFFQELGRDYAEVNLQTSEDLLFEQLEDHELEEVLRIPLQHEGGRTGTRSGPVQNPGASFMEGGPNEDISLVGQILKVRRFADPDKVTVREGDQRKEFDFDPAYNRKALEGKPARKK